MYHEQTKRDIARKRRTSIVVGGLVCALALCAWLVFGLIRANAREQGAASLRNAIVESAKQCCAVEGSYPSSLEHLEQSFGLSVNHQDYVVTYESFASNIIPSVVVVPR